MVSQTKFFKLGIIVFFALTFYVYGLLCEALKNEIIFLIHKRLTINWFSINATFFWTCGSRHVFLLISNNFERLLNCITYHGAERYRDRAEINLTIKSNCVKHHIYPHLWFVKCAILWNGKRNTAWYGTCMCSAVSVQKEVNPLIKGNCCLATEISNLRRVDELIVSS